MRVKKKSWAKDFISKNSNLFINDEQELKEFVSEGNVNLEIGCGKGRFIRTLAKENPDKKYLALEKFESVIVVAAKPFEEERLDNVKFIMSDVVNFNDYDFLSNKFDKIYLNFSDPWPKTRHHKRRLTFNTFLKLYERILVDDGVIIQKTDNKSLFEFSIESFSQNDWYLSNISIDLHKTQRENIMTEYEEKFSNKGLTINYLEARKVKHE